VIYAVSDLHGCPVEEFEALLERAGFGEADRLYVLGDVIDRGPWGLELLCRIMDRPNIHFLLGNHESILLNCSFLFGEEEIPPERMTRRQLLFLENWMLNGGGPTLRSFLELRDRDPKQLSRVLEFLNRAPLYQVVKAGGREFILCHSGLGGFHRWKPLRAYSPRELLWERPGKDTFYYPDKTVIFGHTPTVIYGENYRGREYRTDSWICIDAGAAMGESPMLLRLDDLESICVADHLNTEKESGGSYETEK